MKLSNTMIMNEALLPSSKKAFTLAEVLITLSILGVVAALTIPSLVNRQSDQAALTKIKKAISQYEQVAEVYMVENESTDFQLTVPDGSTLCGELGRYFKVINSQMVDTQCVFTTGDGAVWVFNANGNAVVYDSAKSPRLGVAMWAKGGVVNSTNAIDGGVAAVASEMATAPTAGITFTDGKPLYGYYSAITVLQNTEGTKMLTSTAPTTPSAAF